MSDLVTQARSYGGCSEATHEVSELIHGLADRIEQIERELEAERAISDLMYGAIDGVLFGDPGTKKLPKSVSAMRPARSACLKLRGL